MTSPSTRTPAARGINRAAFVATRELQGQKDMLTFWLTAGHKHLTDQLTEKLCPYSTGQLDAHKKQLDERFPEYEHRYIRCGATVTWCDRRKPVSDT